ncbi:MAG: flagellar hook assembly protein FlgD [Gammaproteobacteria bacterium]
MTSIDNTFLEGLGISSRPEPKKNDQLGQAEFLKLMTTQLQNQDPTKPMEGAEFFSQIAQFSSVASIQELHNSFQQVATAMYSNQALQASAMVGRSVLVASDTANSKSASGVSGTIDLPSSTAALSVDIVGTNGQLVRKINLGQQASGQIGFKWDGFTDDGAPAPDGEYQIKANALLDGKPVDLQTYIAAKVDSVTLGKGQEIKLNLTGMGQLELSKVKQVM